MAWNRCVTGTCHTHAARHATVTFLPAIKMSYLDSLPMPAHSHCHYQKRERRVNDEHDYDAPIPDYKNPLRSSHPGLAAKDQDRGSALSLYDDGAELEEPQASVA